MQGKLKSMQINQNDVGRSVDEALRLLDAFQYVEKHGVVWCACRPLTPCSGARAYLCSLSSALYSGICAQVPRSQIWVHTWYSNLPII